mmetsp:Transcript_1338/g.1518  ORF Transcript_1338/g.1518 Transcript_1338/m.1518 type:complete len:160 (-) Transcript_1338:109-588(-)
MDMIRAMEFVFLPSTTSGSGRSSRSVSYDASADRSSDISHNNSDEPVSNEVLIRFLIGISNWTPPDCPESFNVEAPCMGKTIEMLTEAIDKFTQVNNMLEEASSTPMSDALVIAETSRPKAAIQVARNILDYLGDYECQATTLTTRFSFAMHPWFVCVS